MVYGAGSDEELKFESREFMDIEFYDEQISQLEVMLNRMERDVLKIKPDLKEGWVWKKNMTKLKYYMNSSMSLTVQEKMYHIELLNYLFKELGVPNRIQYGINKVKT